MSEIGAEIPQEEQQKTFDRRKFIKKSAAAAIATPLLINEIQKGLEGSVDTPHGTFIPLYERHDIGISEDEIPDDLDGFFEEIMMKDLHTKSLFNILETRDEYHRSIFSGPIQEKVIDKHCPIILGDVLLPDLSLSKKLEYRVSFGAAVTHLLMIRNKNASEAKINRRKLLKKTTGALMAWGLSNTVTEALVSGFQDKNVATERVAQRLNGLVSHFHPNDAVIFFRNAVMADKMLEVAKNFQEDSDHKPRIAFNVGAAHQGIEDFLQAGQDVCRTAIAAYPKNYIRETVGLNNSIEDFSSARIIRKKNTEIKDNGTTITPYEDYKITDDELSDTLLMKLAY